MSRLRTIAVAIAATLSVIAAMSAEAGAVTWHNSGDTAFTAGSSTPTTLSGTGVNLTCTGWDMTGTAPSASFVGTIYSLATGTKSGTGCSLSGIPTSVSCSYTFTASSMSGTVISGETDQQCSITQFGSEICKGHGKIVTHFVSPGGNVPDYFTHTHATLKSTNGTAGSCPLGANEALTIRHTSEVVSTATGGPTPHVGPRVVRTA